MHTDPFVSARLKLSIPPVGRPGQIVMYFFGKKKKVRSITDAPVKSLSVLYYDQRSHRFSDERLLRRSKKKQVLVQDLLGILPTPNNEI